MNLINQAAWLAGNSAFAACMPRRNMPQDTQLAAQQYWRATKLGDSWSANRLVILFEEGLGDTRDRLVAAKFYGIAAARENREGKINLDRILSESPELQGPFMAWFKPGEEWTNDGMER
ncbi:MAG: hypothetical protein ACRERV_06300 [Methylococcales bacterium]